MQALWQWWGAQASPKKKSGESWESAELQEKRRPKGREWTGRSEEAAGGLSGSRVQPGRETGDAVSSHVMTAADQQGSAEHSEDCRAAELQTVASLKVTIQQRSESREFGQSDRQTAGLHCHVCNLTCRSLQVFQEHMVGSEHLRKLREITQSVCVSAHTLQDRGRQTDTQRWCDTCQAHFSGDVITHRRTDQHKMCKRLCRPFCPVCERHFRTPRKFVEHVKSTEHKQQANRQKVQEEELITVDAIGCFEGEEDEDEEEVEVADEEDSGEEEEEEGEAGSGATLQAETQQQDDDPQDLYGSSFVVPVSGFLCRLCNKFFRREASARHAHCRTQTHFVKLQTHRAAQRRCEGEGCSAPT
ncbi:cdkn1a interacting zinc finger protein 1b isoform X3 [Nelusetta ayraudi]|uniref:cdkn1a interacting zinc finger protein 1b isoform X3 n=1 Tax=Nelusetta ayraudi TaxID=303726 RepID=UPI003F6F0B6F